TRRRVSAGGLAPASAGSTDSRVGLPRARAFFKGIGGSLFAACSRRRLCPRRTQTTAAVCLGFRRLPPLYRRTFGGSGWSFRRGQRQFSRQSLGQPSGHVADFQCASRGLEVCRPATFPSNAFL